ncbi:MAG: phenylacetate--CoA ligase family protein [Candidatus Lokiarchaeia archaeon]
MSRIWTPSIESMEREQLEELQTQLLRKQLDYVYYRAPFYHKQFDKSGVKPNDVKTVNDLQKLPLTKAEDLQTEMKETGDEYSGRLCVPESELLAVYGPNQHPMPENPLITGITDSDRNTIIQHLARNLIMTGIYSGETIQSLCWAWEPFNRIYIAANLLISPSVSEILGITPVTLEIIPLEAPRTFSTARLLKPSLIIADIGHLMQLATICQQNNISPEEMGYKTILLKEQRILSDKETKEVSEKWKAKVHNMLAVQDNMFYVEDCNTHKGLHIWEDAFIAEIVDEETGKKVGDGEAGKLVITNLFAKGNPMIRYLTNVSAKIDRTPCDCGRTHSRLKPQ